MIDRGDPGGDADGRDGRAAPGEELLLGAGGHDAEVQRDVVPVVDGAGERLQQNAGAGLRADPAVGLGGGDDAAEVRDAGQGGLERRRQAERHGVEPVGRDVDAQRERDRVERGHVHAGQRGRGRPGVDEGMSGGRTQAGRDKMTRVFSFGAKNR